MYFTLEPKRKIENLYDRKTELAALKNIMANGRMALLTGIRRIGKTSLLQVFLEESRKKNKTQYAFLDCRRFVKNNRIDRGEFDSAFEDSVKKALTKRTLSKILNAVSDADINTPLVRVNLKKQAQKHYDIFQILDNINEGLGRDRRQLIIAFDEAQNLRFYGVGGKSMLNLFAHIFDHLNNIKVIITGSEVGLLHDFLKLENSDSPLYGRYIEEVELKRFEKEQSVDFLLKGFSQVHFKADRKEIEKAVSILDGMVGYLVIYGYIVYTRKSYDKAIEKSVEMAEKLVKREIEELRIRSENHIKVLKAVAFGTNTFSKIKKYIEINYGNINDQTLSKNLQLLTKQGFLEYKYDKGSKVYFIPDPIVSKVVMSLK